MHHALARSDGVPRHRALRQGGRRDVSVGDWLRVMPGGGFRVDDWLRVMLGGGLRVDDWCCVMTGGGLRVDDWLRVMTGGGMCDAVKV